MEHIIWSNGSSMMEYGIKLFSRIKSTMVQKNTNSSCFPSNRLGTLQYFYKLQEILNFIGSKQSSPVSGWSNLSQDFIAVAFKKLVCWPVSRIKRLLKREINPIHLSPAKIIGDHKKLQAFKKIIKNHIIMGKRYD